MSLRLCFCLIRPVRKVRVKRPPMLSRAGATNTGAKPAIWKMYTKENRAARRLVSTVSDSISVRVFTLMARLEISPAEKPLKNDTGRVNSLAKAAHCTEWLILSRSRIRPRVRVMEKRAEPTVAPMSRAASGNRSLLVPVGITLSKICLFM